MPYKITGSYFRDERYQNALDFFNLGDYKKAIKGFKRHLDKFPNDKEIHALLGSSYYYLDNLSMET